MLDRALPRDLERERVSFNQLNKKTGNRIRYKKVDAETEREVASDEIIKGYEVDKNVYVTVEDEEIEALQVESNPHHRNRQFVPSPRSTRATRLALLHRRRTTRSATMPSR